MAIAIPVFTTQLEKSREATDVANVRSAYAALMTEYLQNPASCKSEIEVSAKAAQDEWQTKPDPKLETLIDGSMATVNIPAKNAKKTGDDAKYTVKLDRGTGKVEVK